MEFNLAVAVLAFTSVIGYVFCSFFVALMDNTTLPTAAKRIGMVLAGLVIIGVIAALPDLLLEAYDRVHPSTVVISGERQ